MKKKLLLIMAAGMLIGCDNAKENAAAPKRGYEIDETLPSSGESLPAGEKEEKLAMLMAQSKRTIDSIDTAYKSIRTQSDGSSLTLEEREQVSEALMELSDAKDLVVLQMQESVIADLKAKTLALQAMVGEMNNQSQKMMRMAATLSKVSTILSTTTNALAEAVTMGLVRPRMSGVNGQ